MVVEHEWDDATGEVGTMVVVPEGDRSARVGIRVVMGITKDPTTCTLEAPDGCIVSRRRVQFLEHKPLHLPIGLYAICEGVPCDPESTCNALGECVPSPVPQCTEPNDPECRY